MRKYLASFIVSAALVVAWWAWLGQPVAMPASPVKQGERLHCVSYAPFKDRQTPLDPTTVIPPAQIDEDLSRLARLTECVRIYSVDLGLDKVPEIAERHGLKVLLGIWISSEAKRNQEQMRIGVALANKHPVTVRGMIVGNEVLLRGEMTAANLEGLIRTVKQQVQVPVTYADVWEYWTRNPQLGAVVDFVTVHILPYWEDLPIDAARAADHIASIRAQVGEAFPRHRVLIGEAGWPSIGRMREGALPSPAAQARVLHDLVARSRAEGFDVNLIEAFDQPWKRRLEGTVGGHWGLFTPDREAKFAWGLPVSNHPLWRWQALLGVLLAAAVIAAAMKAGSVGSGLALPELASLSAISVVAGMTIGGAVEAAYYESLDVGGWLRSVLLVAVCAATPIVAALALARRTKPVAFAAVIGIPEGRTRDAVARALAVLLIVTAVLAIESALGLTFNPRYLDFPYAALTGAVVPALVLTLLAGRIERGRQAAEAVMASILGVCALKIVWMETMANWQAVWLATMLVLLAVTLARVRAARD